MRNAIQLCLAANNLLLMCKGNCAFLLLVIAFAWKWQIASLPEDIHEKNKLVDQMIKQLLNSVIAKYNDLSVSRRSIICLGLRLQIIDLFATDKSWYFAQPRLIIIVNYFLPSGHYLIFTVTWRIPHRSLPNKCLCHVTFVEITSSLTYCQQVSDLHLHYVHLRSFNIRRYFI